MERPVKTIKFKQNKIKKYEKESKKKKNEPKTKKKKGKKLKNKIYKFIWNEGCMKPYKVKIIVCILKRIASSGLYAHTHVKFHDEDFLYIFLPYQSLYMNTYVCVHIYIFCSFNTKALSFCVKCQVCQFVLCLVISLFM